MIQTASSNLTNGQTDVTVVFPTVFPSLPIVLPVVVNLTDNTPVAVVATVTALTVTGFTARLNPVPDGAAYVLTWLATDNTGVLSTELKGQFLGQRPVLAALSDTLLLTGVESAPLPTTALVPWALIRQAFANIVTGITLPGDAGAALALALSEDEGYLLVRTSTQWKRAALVEDSDWDINYRPLPERRGVYDLGTSVTTADVVYAVPFASGTTPVVHVSVRNLAVPATTNLIHAMVVASSLAGFSVILSGETPDADYQLTYSAWLPPT